MPTITGLFVASLAGWGLDAALGDSLGGAGLALSFAVSTVLFYVARRFMVRLRDG
jgi:hypothetical protein